MENDEKHIFTMEEIATDAAFKKYIGKSNTSKSTKEAYKYALARWSTHVQMMPDDALKKAKEEQMTIFDVNDRTLDTQLSEFSNSLKDLSS
ncbi:hypothetical protein, partial [Methanomethylovorans sp. PtaU1.Bin093]|uniref:hypothetical protein n=1 Tax=Methanomethylovorans sp. PtaU1.Bin093 TaxID=1811679 RepID=UPI0025D5A6A8